MATMDRKGRERLTEIAKLRLPVLKTSGDVYAWYGDYFAKLGAKILGGLINDERLRIDAAKKAYADRLWQRGVERRAINDAFPYSPENLVRRGQGKGVGIAWSRERKAQIQDAKDIVAEDRRASDIEFSEGPGERAPRKGSDIEVQ